MISIVTSDLKNLSNKTSIFSSPLNLKSGSSGKLTSWKLWARSTDRATTTLLQISRIPNFCSRTSSTDTLILQAHPPWKNSQRESDDWSYRINWLFIGRKALTYKLNSRVVGDDPDIYDQMANHASFFSHLLLAFFLMAARYLPARSLPSLTSVLNIWSGLRSFFSKMSITLISQELSLWTMSHPPVCKKSPEMPGTSWVSLILRGPGGNTYKAPGVLFCTTTVDYWERVVILVKPEKSERIVSSLLIMCTVRGS